MIYTTVDLTIGNDLTTASRKVILYRGDKNVEIRFVMKGNNFVVLNSMYAQLVIVRPSASSVFSEVAEINNNTVILTVTESMIDGLLEIGDYTFQIRLFDDNLNARVTLPPIQNGLTIKQPIAIEESENESVINYARVNNARVMTLSTESEETIFDSDNIYQKTNWQDGDIITDTKMNKIEEALYYISRNGGGGGGGATAPYISTSLPETSMVNTGEDFQLNVDFNSPNIGKGTLKVFINDIEILSTKIDQGESNTAIPGSLFSKGTNQLTIYVIDRVGVMSNSLTFYVRYGGLELTSTFDPYIAYDSGSVIRYYFIPTALDTSLTLTFYMEIDGVLQNGVECTSDVRSFFTFSNDITVGRHYCRAWVSDGSKNSNVLVFNLIILDESSIVVASDTQTITEEEDAQIVLDYKVYMKNESTFNTKIYLDSNLISSGTCNLETNYYRTDSIPEGLHTIKLEVSDIGNTVSDYVTWTVNITASQYEMLTPVVTGSTFIASAKNKTNSDENKDIWIGTNQDNEEVSCVLSNFSFNSENGWVDNELIISGESYVEIPITPLANNAKYGFTLDIEFSTKPIGVENAEVLSLWNDELNCGIKITTEELILKSKDQSIRLYFSEDEIISAIFIIDRDEKTAKVYLNGVCCRAFALSDYTANGTTYLEDFTVNGNIILGGLNTNGYCKIRNIRVYEVALSTSEIQNNWLSNITNKQQQKDKLNFQKGDSLPTLTVYGDFSGLGKKDKKPCDIVFNSTDVTKYGESFRLEGKYSMLQYQGTSSMQYPIKNYRLNPRDQNGKVKLDPFLNGIKESRFTLKADSASSGHWQNTGLAKWVNDNLYDYDENDQNSMNPMKWYSINNGGNLSDTRETINGFPCRLILVNDGETPLNEGQNEPTPGNTKDMGIFNFNNDKDNVKTLGLDRDIFPYCMSFEVASNSDTSAGAFFSYKGTDPSEELSYLQESFELRFPDSDDVGADYGYLNIDGDSGKGLKRVVDFVDNSSDEDFLANFDQYFNRDYTQRYYILVIVLAMVDNLGKNMMLDTWDGIIWMPRFYDMDTICSFNNTGVITFDTDIEMEQGYWNTSASRLWTRVRDLMHDELIEKYKSMRQNGLSYESFMQYFYGEQIAKIPEAYYNKDYDVKYAPYADQYAGLANGSSLEHLKRWLKRRIMFTDTLFDYAPSYTNDSLTIRANTTETMTLEIETYAPVYQHLSWYNNQMDKKKIDGKTSVTFTGKAQAATDQEVIIYGGSNIKRIRGIATMNPNSMLIGNATRLMELECTGATLLTDINSNKANLSPNSYLSKVNLNGCSALGGSLRINNSPLIQEIDIKGTSIENIIFPTSLRNLKVLKIPSTIKSLTLNNLNLLTNIDRDEGEPLQELNLTNCSGLNIDNLNLEQIPKVLLDNTFNSEIELRFINTVDLTLKNMLNLERVIYEPNNEYEEFNMETLTSSKNYTINISSCPKLKDFITTAKQRISYGIGETTINPFKVFTANILDLQNTTIENIKLLCTTDVNKLLLPNTVKNFYCDSSFDLDTEVLTDGDYDTIHGVLVEPYTTDYTNNVLLNDVTPKVIPTSANGSLIFSMYAPKISSEPSSGVWDLAGLKFNDFHTFGMNNSIKMDYYKLYIGNDIKAFKKVDNVGYMYQNSYNSSLGYSVLRLDSYLESMYKEYGRYSSMPIIRFESTVEYILIETNLGVNQGVKLCYLSPNSYGFEKSVDGRDLYWFLPNKCTGERELAISYLPEVEWIQISIVSYTEGNSGPLSKWRFLVKDFVGVDINSVGSTSDFINNYKISPYLTTKFKIEADFNGNITMPKRYSGYKVQIQNADISPSDYNTMLYPLLVDTSLPITGKLDYSKYKGNNLSWAYAYTTDAVDIVPVDSRNISNIEYDYNKLYGTTFVDVVDIWVYKDTDTSTLSTNENITKAYIELTQDNYLTRIDEIIQYFPNCTDLYLFDDGSVTDLSKMFYGNNTTCKTQIVNIEFLDGYFNNLTNLYQTFGNMNSLTSVNNIPDTVKKLSYCFYNSPMLNKQFDFSNLTLVDGGLEGIFDGCTSLTNTPILPSNYTGSLKCSFRNTKITTPPILPSGVTNVQECFSGCSELESVPDIPEGSMNLYRYAYYCSSIVTPPTIPEGVDYIRECFAGCSSLTEAPILPSTLVDMNSAFNGCSSLTEAPVIPTGVTSINASFCGCKLLTIAPNIPEGVTNMRQTFTDCSALTTAINIPESVIDMYMCFSSCPSLKNVAIPLTNISTYNNVLNNFNHIEDITWVGLRSSSFNLSTLGGTIPETDIKELVNNHLATVESATLTLGSTYLAYLTEEEIAGAVAKGWILE